MLVVMISVKKIGRNHYVVEIQDLGVSIHVMPYEKLRTAVNADVADKDEDAMMNLLTDVSRRCEEIKQVIGQSRKSVVASDCQDELSASTTHGPFPDRRYRSLTKRNSPEDDLKDVTPAPKKRR
jgi:hypothetical protein